jgi:excisionase family DNA binding protein
MANFQVISSCLFVGATVPTPVPRRYASIAEAAAYLDVSQKTIRRMIAAGEIHGYRFSGRVLRVDLNELNAIRPIPTVGGAS